MEPLTIEQYKALIKEDQIKIGEDVEESFTEDGGATPIYDLFHLIYPYLK